MTHFTELVDLAAERLGATVIAANDEFFAPKEGLLKPGPAEWREGEYTARGKWMDGWETRRRRDDEQFDWCIIRLGAPGIVHGVIVDTSFYRGNYPEACSIEGCEVAGTPSADDLILPSTVWRDVLTKSPLRGDTKNELIVHRGARATHLRLNIFPDGGVARLRVHGEAVPDPWRLAPERGEVDLASAELGGRVLACSDMFFGSRHNMIMPGRSTHMGDGWETKRKRTAGHDWSIVQLAAPGVITRIEVDTDHFQGNAPAACSFEVSSSPAASTGDLGAMATTWHELMPRTPLQPNARHIYFQPELRSAEEVTHIRMNIFPDGGIARLRLYGRPAARP